MPLHDPEVVPGEGSRQVALTPMAPLGDGVYTVTFRVVSRTDGHLTAGSIAFGVGQVTGEVVPTASAPTEDPWPSALSVIGKTLLYVGLILIFGAAVVGMGAFAGEVPGRRVLLPLAGVTALVGACLMLVAEARSVGAGIGHDREVRRGRALPAPHHRVRGRGRRRHDRGVPRRRALAGRRR